MKQRITIQRHYSLGFTMTFKRKNYGYLFIFEKHDKNIVYRYIDYDHLNAPCKKIIKGCSAFKKAAS